MKPYSLVLSFTLALFALSSAVVLAGDAAPAPTVAAADRVPPERFDAKVLKVIAAKDGEAIFRAYLVKWKDQEVVASDSLAKTNYKEGDTISVLAMNSAFPQGREPYRLLAFVVVPVPTPR